MCDSKIWRRKNRTTFERISVWRQVYHMQHCHHGHYRLSVFSVFRSEECTILVWIKKNNTILWFTIYHHVAKHWDVNEAAILCNRDYFFSSKLAHCILKKKKTSLELAIWEWFGAPAIKSTIKFRYDAPIGGQQTDRTATHALQKYILRYRYVKLVEEC